MKLSEKERRAVWVKFLCACLMTSDVEELVCYRVRDSSTMADLMLQEFEQRFKAKAKSK